MEALQTANDCLPSTKRKQQKTWMTEEILLLMEERRKHKENLDKYKLLNKQIKKTCNSAKEEFLEKQCKRTEMLYNISPREAHGKI